MKKLLTMVLAAVSCSLAAQELTLQSSGAELIVNASRLTAMTALQFNLELPEGVTIADSDATMGEATDGHTLCMETLAGGERLFILYNINLNTFKDGELLRIPIIINNDGVAKLYKVRFADTEAKSHVGADASAIVIAVASLNITADDQTRAYGEGNPAWTYTVTDGEIYGDGQPTLSCEATSKSPVGTYVIAIEKGTVQNPATFTKGTLTITKAPLTITASSYTMKQGDPLPSFDVSYEGFKNGETKSVLTKQPKVTCSATAASEPGRYDIIMSGATADNYEITHVKGTLRIRSLVAELGDLNDDGEVDITDVVELIDMVLAGE